MFDSIVTDVTKALTALRDDVTGTAAIEYGLLASLIAIASMQALDTLGAAVTDTFDTTRSAMAEGRVETADEPPVAAADEPSTAASRVAG